VGITRLDGVRCGIYLYIYAYALPYLTGIYVRIADVPGISNALFVLAQSFGGNRTKIKETSRFQFCFPDTSYARNYFYLII